MIIQNIGETEDYLNETAYAVAAVIQTKKILLYMALLFYDYKDITQYNQNRGVFC
jgi:hypothetical protein